MMKVQDLMTSTVITARADAGFKDLIDLMLDNDVSGIPIVDEHERLLGLVTEADLLPKEAFGAKTHGRVLQFVAGLLAGGEPSLIEQAEGRTASDLMTEHVVVAYPEEDARYAAQRMIEHGVKRLPVVDDGRIVGILARSDLLRAFKRDDPELVGAVERLLRASHFRAPQHDIHIAADDGVVTLTGTVFYEGDVEVVGAIVANAEGVVDTRNELAFREEDPPGRA